MPNYVEKKSSAKTADGGLLVTSLSFHNLSITYMTTTNNVLHTIMIAFLTLSSGSDSLKEAKIYCSAQHFKISTGVRCLFVILFSLSYRNCQILSFFY